MSFPIKPDFSFMTHKEASILSKAYTIMTPTTWALLQKYNEYSYIYTTNEQIRKIMRSIEQIIQEPKQQIVIWVIRKLEIISNYGFEKFKRFYLRGVLFPCP